jgi:acyl-CoA reductase-like NAD-dependent aldehyde dehydrogenase
MERRTTVVVAAIPRSATERVGIKPCEQPFDGLTWLVTGVYEVSVRDVMVMEELFVNGQWRPQDGRSMAATSPVDDSTLGSVPMGTGEHVDAAVSATAGAAPELRDQSVYDRAYAIRAAMDALERRSETIVDAMAREVGKPVDEAREELENAIDSGRFYAEDAVRLFGEVTPSKFDDRLNFTRREPYGPAAIVTP